VIMLYGWFCPACKVFNGEEKAQRSTCRACDGPRTGSEGLSRDNLFRILAAMLVENAAMRDNLTAVQGKLSRYIACAQAAKAFVTDHAYMTDDARHSLELAIERAVRQLEEEPATRAAMLRPYEPPTKAETSPPPEDREPSPRREPVPAQPDVLLLHARRMEVLLAVEAAARALREPVGYESGASSHDLDEALACLDELRVEQPPSVGDVVQRYAIDHVVRKCEWTLVCLACDRIGYHLEPVCPTCVSGERGETVVGGRVYTGYSVFGPCEDGKTHTGSCPVAKRLVLKEFGVSEEA
jgi:hypothetical protein